MNPPPTLLARGALRVDKMYRFRKTRTGVKLHCTIKCRKCICACNAVPETRLFVKKKKIVIERVLMNSFLFFS